jgi:ParB family transcriptional regulator, chromosome partitioning protein
MTTTTRTKSRSAADTGGAPEPTAAAVEVVERVDPRGLLIDTNVRIDPNADVDAGLIKSITEHGVLQPIVVVRAREGQLRVRFGHRRTLAAIEAQQATVPVVIKGDEATDDAAQIERILEQWDENEYRAGLRTADKVNTVQQLAAFGLPADQITTRLGTTSRPEVDAALAVAGSDLAKAATARYEFLDLTQAAVIAEFEDDAEAVKRLVAAASTGKQFEHVTQQLRDARTETERQAAFTQRLLEAAITVIDPDRDDVTELHELMSPDGVPLTDENHRQCPGNAAYVITTSGYIDPTTGEPIDEDDDREDDEDEPQSTWGDYCEAQYVCTDPETHGHVSRANQRTTRTHEQSAPQISEQEQAATEAKKEADRIKLRQKIANNKDWASAETVRRQWLKDFITRKSAPKGTASFIATAIAVDAHVVTTGAGHQLACQLLGCEPNHYGRKSALGALIEKSSEARAQVLALAQVLSAYEAKTDRDHWQKQFHQDHVKRYLRFLQANKYDLSPVELLACGQTPQPATEDPADSGDQGD